MSHKAKAKRKAGNLFNLTDDTEVDDLPSVLSQWIPRPPDSNRMHKLCSVSGRKQVKLPKVDDAASATEVKMRQTTDFSKLSPRLQSMAQHRKNPTGPRNYGEAKLFDTERKNRMRVSDPGRIEILSQPTSFHMTQPERKAPWTIAAPPILDLESPNDFVKSPLEYAFKADLEQEMLEVLMVKAARAGLSDTAAGVLRRVAMRELAVAPFTVPGLAEGLSNSDEITVELARKRLKELMPPLWDRYVAMMGRGGIAKLDETFLTEVDARRRIIDAEAKWASELKLIEANAQRILERKAKSSRAKPVGSPKADQAVNGPKPEIKDEPAKGDGTSSAEAKPCLDAKSQEVKEPEQAAPVQPSEVEPSSQAPEVPEGPSEDLQKAKEIMQKEISAFKKAHSQTLEARTKALEIARGDLVLASRAGILPLIRPLLADRRVVEPDKPVGPEMSRAVAGAARFGHATVVRQLLNLRDRIDSLQPVEESGNVWSAWEEAVLFGHKDTVRTLAQKSTPPAVGPAGPPELLAALIPDVSPAPAPLSESLCKLLVACRKYGASELTTSLRSVCSVQGGSIKQARSVAALTIMLNEKWGEVSLACVQDGIAAKNFELVQLLLRERRSEVVGSDISQTEGLGQQIAETFAGEFPDAVKELQESCPYFWDPSLWNAASPGDAPAPAPETCNESGTEVQSE